MFDVVIIGAGAAGMFCASSSKAKGLKVLLLEHNNGPGKKILISGGGRCNFTNIHTKAENFVSENPHFCKSALSRYTPDNFINLVEKHGIKYHEKKHGQLFCNNSASQIVKMLYDECTREKVETWLGTQVKNLTRSPEGNFYLETSRGAVEAKKVAIATGGLSFPKIGASDFGFKIARQFGLKVTPLYPALDGFTLGEDYAFLKALSGLSLDTILTCENKTSFQEKILFTHKGLSGPAALQGSLYWKKGESIFLNVLPEIQIERFLSEGKKISGHKFLKNLLGEFLPNRFSESFCSHYFSHLNEMAEISDEDLNALSGKLSNWEIKPSGTVGYSKAEVTRGGVDTNELSSKTMEAKKVPGLFFIGEVIDVTGQLGGFNFQWAWASAAAAAEAF